MRPPLAVAAIALAWPAVAAAQPGPAQSFMFPAGRPTQSFMFPTGQPLPQPGFGLRHPGRFHHFFGQRFRPFGGFAPFGFVPTFGAGLYGYGPWWSYNFLEDQPPAPLIVYENTAPAPAMPMRWGSSTLELAPTVADPRAAVITVQLPVDAVLYVQGKKQSALSGPTRQVVTPPLQRGRAYEYGVKAVWVRDGHTVEREQRLTVRAGDRQSITFPTEPQE